MHILTYTSLYPNTLEPVHGIFVNELVKSLERKIRVSVVAPVNGFRSLLARQRHTPFPSAQTEGTFRCRFWTIPRIFKSLDCRFMAHFSRRAFYLAMLAMPDLIHAHYAYPDAAAAAILARQAGLPLVVTCHGSDINVLAQDPARKRLMVRSLRQAAAVVAVSSDLAGKIARLGVDPARIHHIPNGVDLSRFVLGDKLQARRFLNLEERGPILVAAGRLEPVKGYDRLLRALARLDNVRLVLAGDGTQRDVLERLALKLDLSGRVRFDGMVDHAQLAPYFQAADALVISSHSEGWPTIIHEALACGTPVVAPAVGGIPEALADPALGLIVPSGEPEVLATGIQRVLDASWDQSALRQAATAHDWNVIAARYVQLYNNVLLENQ